MLLNLLEYLLNYFGEINIFGVRNFKMNYYKNVIIYYFLVVRWILLFDRKYGENKRYFLDLEDIVF